MRVWSISPFFNELDVLEIKLAELSDVVDVFVLSESPMTHSGLSKDLHLSQNIARFSRWLHKMRVVVADLSLVRVDDNWARERAQREALGYAMGDIGDDDVVVISDLDEIVKADSLRAVLDGSVALPVHFNFPIHPYRLDWRWDTIERGFCSCRVVPASLLRKRRNRESMFGINAALAGKVAVLTGEYGWHFTYQGGAASVASKISSIADEWVRTGDAWSDEDWIRQSIETGADVFGRDHRRTVPVPLAELPAYVQRHTSRFSHMLGGGEVQ